jgi:DNA-binding GntR family transcriptional regulator
MQIERTDKEGLRDRVLDAIERALLTSALKPGDRVVEANIAREANISRGPVREAIQHLVADGILVSEPHRGTFVARWTAADVAETYGLRALLESYAARLAMASMTSAQMTELEQLVEEMCTAAKTGDGVTMYRRDIQFHHRLYELSGHKLLTRMVHDLERRISLLVNLDATTTRDLMHYAQNHRLLLESLQSGDPERAEHVFREHILAVGNALVQRMKEEHQLAEDAAANRTKLAEQFLSETNGSQ